VGIFGAQHANRCSVPSLSGEWFASILGTCASSSTTHVVHAWWDTNSFCPHCQTAPEPHLTFGEQWIRRGGPVNWPARSPDFSHLDFWLWGHLNTSVHSAPISDSVALQQERFDWNYEFSTECGHLCPTQSCKLCSNAWETHRAPAVDINAHVSAGTGLGTFVDCDCLCSFKRGLCRGQWPDVRRHELSSPAQTLGLWVRTPLEIQNSVCVYNVFVLCVGSGLTTNWSPVQGILRAGYRIMKLKKTARA
jgi:hypothetical protein